MVEQHGRLSDFFNIEFIGGHKPELTSIEPSNPIIQDTSVNDDFNLIFGKLEHTDRDRHEDHSQLQYL